MLLLKEGKVKFYATKSVFYNPAAEMSRDIAVAALQVFQRNSGIRLTVCDPLAATGIRGLRYAAEVKGIKAITVADKNPVAVGIIKKNIRLNKLGKKCKAVKADANVLLHENVYNYIDLDPFGPPVPFMDSAARSIWHKGFIGVTATDTAPLCGTFPPACLRKYGLRSLKTDFYNELGVRLLTSFIILSLARREKAFVPVLAYATRHYFRVYGRIEHIGQIEPLLKQFSFVMWCPACDNHETGEPKAACSVCGKPYRIAGPVFMGPINNRAFCQDVLHEISARKFRLKGEELKLLNMIVNEADLPPLYYELNELASKHKLTLKTISEIINNLHAKGFVAGRTHFCTSGIRTNAPLKELINTAGMQ
jgi:tRNA (guanine26-N2/guanine27-N2)-dimethyltransferase